MIEKLKLKVWMNELHNLFMTGLLLGSISFSFSQQLPQYSQFGINRFVVNPAVAGTEEYTYIQSSYRTQWVGLQGAPQSGYLSAHSPVGKTNIGQSYARSRQKEAWLSAGGIVAYDKVGPIKQTSVHATIAYNLPISRRGLRVSFGLNLGIKRFSYNPDGFTDNLKDLNDASIFTSYNKVNPDGSLGVWLYDEHFFAGLSSFQLFGNDIGVDLAASGKNVQHYLGMVGYKVDINETMYWVPSLLLKNVPGLPLSLDFNAKLFIEEKYWLGANYRYGDSFAAFIGVLIANNLELSYSYDAVTSPLAKHTSGSHEVLVGYRINKGSRLVSPSDFW